MHSSFSNEILAAIENDRDLTVAELLSLDDRLDLKELMRISRHLADIGHGDRVTYSPKVFIPLTRLCRDVCHYCTFATVPRQVESPYMQIEEILELCRKGVEAGCREALFTLGERPEARYSAARDALQKMGFSSTLDYVSFVAGRVLEETGLLPHINAGCMDSNEIAQLRSVSASMGIMLESSSERLCEKGMPHYGSPDKIPERRLHTIDLAGMAKVPFTSGILIGIGETRLERIESLLELRSKHRKWNHIQEIIIQNFRAKPNTLMEKSPEPDLDELLWTISVCRLIFGSKMNIQVPPNLNPGVLSQLISSGINDWGGISPVTPDHVNPEAPWPHLERLRRETEQSGKFLQERLTIYPEFASRLEHWVDLGIKHHVLAHCDSQGLGRENNWVAGQPSRIQTKSRESIVGARRNISKASRSIIKAVERCEAGLRPSFKQLQTLFDARGEAFDYVLNSADRMRQQSVGDNVTYVINRNINYTNVCTYKCRFCAFSKQTKKVHSNERSYDISGEELARRTREAWQRGATEVCLQGGIHPDYTGQTYIDIISTVREACPQIHIHAFSPLEIMHGAKSLNVEIAEFLTMLKDVGLNTLPGTAAEILHDEVRKILCPDKLTSSEWLNVMNTAHRVGFRTTATIMFGHVDSSEHWAEHILAVRDLQADTGGFTEFVPLPFVPTEAPAFYRGLVRKGPTWREAILMHAVSRLAFMGLIENIQVSWVKMGREGAVECLKAGANDLGGSLMNESITRAAGSKHGQEWSPVEMDWTIRNLGRIPCNRTTLYQEASSDRIHSARNAIDLLPVENLPAAKKAVDKKLAANLLANDMSFKNISDQVFLMAASN